MHSFEDSKRVITTQDIFLKADLRKNGGWVSRCQAWSFNTEVAMEAGQDYMELNLWFSKTVEKNEQPLDFCDFF